MAIAFLVIVVLYGKTKNIILGVDTQSEIGYSARQLIFSVLGELIRAFLTSWLYKYHKTNKAVITNAIQFGIICSALIGSIWLLIGMEFLNPKNKLSFIIDDGIILTLQGLISGIILWLLYRCEEKPAHNNP